MATWCAVHQKHHPYKDMVPSRRYCKELDEQWKAETKERQAIQRREYRKTHPRPSKPRDRSKESKKWCEECDQDLPESMFTKIKGELAKTQEREDLCRDCMKQPVGREILKRRNLDRNKRRRKEDPEATRAKARAHKQRAREKDPRGVMERRWQSFQKKRCAKYGVQYTVITWDELEATYGTDCYLCGLPTVPRTLDNYGDDLRIEWDHVISFLYGGEHTLENLRPSHHSCNDSKQNLTLEEYREREAAKQSPEATKHTHKCQTCFRLVHTRRCWDCHPPKPRYRTPKGVRPEWLTGGGRKPSKFSEEALAAIVRRRDAGETFVDIAASLDSFPSTVQRNYKRVKEQRKGRQGG